VDHDLRNTRRDRYWTLEECGRNVLEAARRYPSWETCVLLFQWVLMCCGGFKLSFALPRYVNTMAAETELMCLYQPTTAKELLCRQSCCVDRGCIPIANVNRFLQSSLHSSCTCIVPRLLALKFRRSQNVELSEVLVGTLRLVVKLDEAEPPIRRMINTHRKSIHKFRV
jgi:hypothetical protein